MTLQRIGKIAVLLGPDFEDVEFIHPVAKLREAGHTVEVLGTERIESSRGSVARSRSKPTRPSQSELQKTTKRSSFPEASPRIGYGPTTTWSAS
jgi:putative intracellular protease/amidase